MKHSWITGIVVSVLSAAAYSATPIDWMLAKQVITSAQVQNGQGVVMAGPHFFNADFSSQQDISGWILQYLQTQTPGVTQFNLIDSTSGLMLGSYSAGVLTLASH